MAETRDALNRVTTSAVTIERVWFGFGGRSVRPSCEQAAIVRVIVSRAAREIKRCIEASLTWTAGQLAVTAATLKSDG